MDSLPETQTLAGIKAEFQERFDGPMHGHAPASMATGRE
jgi:hypothetical protein